MAKFALLGLLFLAGCAQVDQFVANDATAAASIAQASGDAAAVPCYNAIGVLTKTPVAGLLSKFELVRAGQQLAQGSCSGVFAGLVLHLLNKVPGAP